MALLKDETSQDKAIKISTEKYKCYTPQAFNLLDAL